MSMNLFRLLRSARNQLHRHHIRDIYYPTGYYMTYEDLFQENERLNKILDHFEEEFQRMDEDEFEDTRKPAHRLEEADKKKVKKLAGQHDQKEEKQGQLVRKANNWNDVLGNLDLSASKTLERANKIFEQSVNVEHPDLILKENDDLLHGEEHEFDDFAKYFNEKDHKEDMTASNFESSTIFKDGKTVTVTKHSKLNPDGTINTVVNQEFTDKNGKKDSRKWVKEDSLKKDQKELKGAKEQKEHKELKGHQEQNEHKDQKEHTESQETKAHVH